MARIETIVHSLFALGELLPPAVDPVEIVTTVEESASNSNNATNLRKPIAMIDQGQHKPRVAISFYLVTILNMVTCSISVS